jgi:predicted permease
MAWSADRFNLANGGEPRYVQGLYVSGDFFHTLGVEAMLGRTLTAQDDSATCNAAAVLSYAFWQREFGGDAAAVGRTVNLNGHAFPVIGVTGPSFFGVEVGSRYDVAIPLCADRIISDDNKGRMPLRWAWWLSAMCRLKPGWTAERSTAYLRAVSPQIMQATVPDGYRPDMAKSYLANKLIATPAGTGVSGLRQQIERPLWVLLATTGIVLLIACANRATVREPEIAVRLAIGASRRRLVSQLLTESLLLAVAGTALGVGIALALSRALVAFISSSNNRVFVDLAVDWRMLGFTAALAVLTCLLFGLLPALRATQLAPASAMRAGSRSVTAGRERVSLRRVLVSTQVALSLVLLFGALLFVRSLHNLMTVDTGFQAAGLLTVSVDFSKSQYPEARRFAVYRELSDRLAAVPGVGSVAQVSFTPISGSWDNLVAPDGASAAGSGKTAFFNRAGPGYFRTMGTSLIAGREFNDRDTASAPNVAIVNEIFARELFGGGANPVGRTFHMAADAGKPEPVYQIVGLVRNTKYQELREDFKPIAFFPIGQDEHPGTGATFVLRAAGPLGLVMNGAKAAVGAMNASMGIELRPLSARLEETLGRERLMATLSGGFGFLAGLLATLGLYGVIAYMVARRRNEIGVRIALGADRANVIRLVLREGILLLGVGLAVGIGLALWAGTAASTLLFGLPPYDVASLVGASALLTAIALIASYVPARRAAALDPMATLRNE